jgi:hypothetical protein
MKSPKSNSPKVFISYSWDSDKHKERVLALSDHLRDEGIDCDIDQYYMNVPEGWARWMSKKVKESDYVLVVCTKTYYQRAMDEEEPGVGKGVKWEGAIITDAIYNNEAKNDKFIPVLFSSEEMPNVPEPLLSVSRYVVSTKQGYEDLCRRLTNQPLTEKPGLGKLKALPPRKAYPGQSEPIQTPGPNPSSENANEPLKFRNRVNELNLIFGSENSLSENTLVVIDAPAGYGKTELLKELQKRYETVGWKYVFVDLEHFSTEAEIRNEIVRQIGGNHILRTDPDPDFNLRVQIALFGKIVLLFDSVEKADEKPVTWLRQFVGKCRDGARSFVFRAIFAGRYITTGEKGLKWKRFKIQERPLTPFKPEVVREIIEEMAEQANLTRPLEDYVEWAKQITRLSGGHPKIIHNFVRKLRETRWTILFNTPNERKNLFQRCAEPEINEMTTVLKKEAKTALEILSIFRHFNFNTVQKLRKIGELHVTDPLAPLALISQLGLVSKKGEFGYYSDAIVRNLILTRMRLSDGKRYYHLNQVAQEIYDGWIEEILSEDRVDEDRVDLVDPHRLINFFVGEGIYHASQLSPKVDLDRLAQYLKKSSEILTRGLGEKENDPNHRESLENIVLADDDICATLEENDISSDGVTDFIRSCF